MNRRFSIEEKLRIVLEGMTTKVTVAELCRKHNISYANFYDWKQKFIEGGRKSLAGDSPNKQTALERENADLKQMVAELAIANNAFKKTLGMKG